ncbi:MAG: hypothetical protein HYZ50_19020 [Deltaproteobacteria bacterium]|nr:hypothetical protein [Deltaproteobacteria bacterium]
MQRSRFSLRKLGRGTALPLGLFLVSAFANQAQATTVAQVCAVAGNTCAAGVASINVFTPIEDASVLDFVTAGFGIVNVNNGGTLQLETKSVGTDGLVCPAKPSTTMHIIANDLAVKAGGKISGDYLGNNAPVGILNGGAIYIEANNTVVVEPAGSITSNRFEKGNGRPGNITVFAGDFIDVQADPSGSPRGVITANGTSASKKAFLEECGLTEITLVATGNATTATGEAIRIAGTVENVFPKPSVEGVAGGIIQLVAGGDDTNFTDPPFPTPSPIIHPNPPQNSARALVTETGLLNIDAKDFGGGIIRVSACFVIVNGLIQVGGNAHNGLVLGKEGQGAAGLPMIVEILANETAVVTPTLPVVPGIADPGVLDPPGGIRADIRFGFRQHIGQGLTDADQGLGTGCQFTVQFPPKDNGPLDKDQRGGADVCVTARAGITVDGTQLVDEFAIRARTGFKSQNNGQVGGTILILDTAEGTASLLNKSIATNGIGSVSRGGRVVIQSQNDVDVDGPGGVQSNPTGASGGGTIDVQAIDGDVTSATGFLTAAPAGEIAITECANTPANNPAANPAAIYAGLNCAGPKLVISVPTLISCGGGCFAPNKVSVVQGVLTLTGTGLKSIAFVEFSAGCTPSFGVNPPNPFVAKANFTSVTDSKIVLTLPAGVNSGDHVILSNPLAKASACSVELIP